MKFFTDQARVAASLARRRRFEERDASKTQLQVFAVRRGTGVSWEIRKFGGIILARGTENFRSGEDAIAAGKLARTSLVHVSI